nr:hypothetical protein GCM10010200_041290 [Actinomadura rugatobispora]
MRFAVRPPWYPGASPRSNGRSGRRAHEPGLARDVANRIHIGIADVAAGPAPETRLALTRPRSVVPHAEQHSEV